MKGKKVICVLLAIILVSVSSINTLATGRNQIEDTGESNTIDATKNNIITELNNEKTEIENKLEEANEELVYVQGELSNTLIEIQELDDKIRKYEEENAQLEQTLTDLEISIKETSEKLEIVTAEYVRKEEQLRNRMVALYEAGDVSYLDVLLSANSLSDFLSIYYAMIQIAEYDNKLIDEVDEQRKQIDTANRKLENESVHSKILKVKVEQNTVILTNIRTLQQGYIERLTEQEKQVNDQIVEFKTEIARLEGKIHAISLNAEDIQIQFTGGTMIWPVAKRGTAISSAYGSREHPVLGVTKFHQGIDIANTGFGAPVVSAADGIVTYAGWLGTYGNCVMVYHGEGITTLYAHGQEIITQYGQNVKQGDVIMTTGSTGRSTGPHLHFEVRINGTTVNPLQFVNIP